MVRQQARRPAVGSVSLRTGHLHGLLLFLYLPGQVLTLDFSGYIYVLCVAIHLGHLRDRALRHVRPRPQPVTFPDPTTEGLLPALCEQMLFLPQV